MFPIASETYCFVLVDQDIDTNAFRHPTTTERDRIDRHHLLRPFVCPRQVPDSSAKERVGGCLSSLLVRSLCVVGVNVVEDDILWGAYGRRFVIEWSISRS